MSQGVCVRWWLIAALALGFTVMSARETFSAEASFDDSFYGLTVFVGRQYHEDPIWHVSGKFDWEELQIRPVAGQHRTERADLWLEGNFTYIRLEDIPDSIELGLSVMTSYDVLKYKRWRLFAELGVGMGWMSATPDVNLVGDNILGFLDYGIGIKLRTKQGHMLKVGPRFHHRSSLVDVDAGMNSYGFAFSLAK